MTTPKHSAVSCPADTSRDARAIYDFVFRFAWDALQRLGCPEADRDDVAERVVVKAARGWANYRATRGTPGQYLWGIVRNELVEYRRELRRQFPVQVGAAVPDVPSESRNPEEIVGQKEMVALVDSAWKSLPELEQRIVWAHEVGEESFERIAELEDLSKTHIARLYQRGMKRLRAAIKRSQAPRAGCMMPLTLTALFDLDNTPAPPPEVVERAWQRQRAIVEPGFTDGPDSAPPASGPRRCAPTRPEGDAAPPSHRAPPARGPKLRLVSLLGPIGGAVLGALVPTMVPRCDHAQDAPSTAAMPGSIVQNVGERRFDSATLPEPVRGGDDGFEERPGPSQAQNAAAPGRMSLRSDRRRSDEWDLLKQARLAFLAQDLLGALDTLTKHALRFPDGEQAAARVTLWAEVCARLRADPQRTESDIAARCVPKP